MRKIEITEEQRSLLQVSLEIALARYRENATKLIDEPGGQRLVAQFDRQARQTDELIALFGEADTITIATAA